MESGAGAGAGGGAACDEAEDAALLAPLSADSFLHNVRARFLRDVIYTWAGGALLSVNPGVGRALPLYSPELARRYALRPPHALPPHLYAAAADAYRWARDTRESQCIIITGESGSGKTEAARVCLQGALLAAGAAGAGATASAAAALLAAAGTALEAFGNAATARNHNASRFGKLVELQLDARGAVAGGRVTHCEYTADPVFSRVRRDGQLERVARPPAGERGFHVLYQLLAGAEPALLQRLGLSRAPHHYRIMRGATTPADTEHFATTKAALARLGVCGAEVLRLLAFLLRLGNVRFEPDTLVDGSLAPRLQRPHELRDACALVGVEPGALLRALGVDEDGSDASASPEEAPAGGEEDEEGEGGAGWARDTLLAAIYGRLFTWLVRAVNEALRGAGSGGGEGGGGGGATLAILDLYGWESLADNGLERLLINYCGERVQASLDAAARRLRAEAAREGLPAPAPATPDPSPAELCADDLDLGAVSVLGALRDCDSDTRFLQRVAHSQLATVTARPPGHFRVAHFAGPVTYRVAGIVRCDRDALPPRAARALAAARLPLLAALFGGVGAGAGAALGSPRRAPTLAGRQRALLAALLRRLPEAAAPARLVRCLRAHAALLPARFDAALVAAQLASQRLVEWTAERRGGWCWREDAAALAARYRALLGAAAGANGARGVARRLARLPLPPAEFAAGATLVFVRTPRTLWWLEWWEAARRRRLAAALQAAWRARAARRAAAAARIARAYRRHRDRPALKARPAPAQSHSSTHLDGLQQHRMSARLAEWWARAAAARYLAALAARLTALGAAAAGPLAPWPPLAPAHARFAAADAELQRLHHRWRCARYRARFDQTARNRMREKVTASALFLGRKTGYARGVPHPFVGDYVRLRAAAAWARAAPAPDRYVVFADVAGKVSARRARPRPAPVLAVLSTAALLLLEPRSLRVRRRVPAASVTRLALSPHADTLLGVQVAGGAAGAGSEADEAEGAACLFGRGGHAQRDLLLETRHALELATKLFLVVQNVAPPPRVLVAPHFDLLLGEAPVTVSFHVGAGGGGGGGWAGGEGEALGGGARLLRRGDTLHVLL